MKLIGALVKIGVDEFHAKPVKWRNKKSLTMRIQGGLKC